MKTRYCRRLLCIGGLLIISVVLMAHSEGFGQELGEISGMVTDAETGKSLAEINVSVKGTTLGAATDRQGRYKISRVPPGSYALLFSAVGYTNLELIVVVAVEEITTMDAQLTVEAIELGNVMVYAASKRSERITDAPSAISTISALEVRQIASTGQLPRLFEAQPGVDIAQNGINDYNLNIRGFNSSLNRRVLVLIDNRELVFAMLGAQEWSALSRPLDDLGRLEIVRGPGSALYGANAFSGVINITTPSPKEIVGTKVSLSGGELSSFRADIRHAGVTGPWGYKINFGYSRSESWDRSRNITQAELDAQEYEGLTPEAFALRGDDLQSTYGSGRIDYELANEGLFTLEGGLAQVENPVYITGIGRLQLDKVHRPWARAAFASDELFFQADYRGRKTFDNHMVSQASGAALKDDSRDFDFQAQTNFSALEEKLRVIIGASHRFRHVDTDKTILPEVFDETFSGLFSQIEYELSDKINLVGATRIDGSSVHDTQFSPKLAIVFSPTVNHSFRATVNSAFQTPNTGEHRLRLPVGQPVDLAPLEADIEAAVGVALPLNFGITPVLALGNFDLEVEKIIGYEVGYKGVIGAKAFITADVYFSRLKNFITDLLPRVNPAYAAYQVPDGIDPALEPIIMDALQNELGSSFPLFSTLPDGSQALVVSFGNAGEVDEWGVELGLNYYLTNEVFFSGNYSLFKFDVNDRTVAIGDNLIPNTPRHKFNLGLTYQSRQGFDAGVHVKYVDRFDWAAGSLVGPIPS